MSAVRDICRLIVTVGVLLAIGGVLQGVCDVVGECFDPSSPTCLVN